jgi:hypothetical protein
MSTFHRSGFWRTGPGGSRHWVRGHEVERDYWGRSSGFSISANQQYALEQLTLMNARYGFSARLVIPNAECPVCGAIVFFYQNHHGSRVWFDELGPPWPKHSCFYEEHAELKNSLMPTGIVTPEARSEDEVWRTRRYREALHEDPVAAFIRTEKATPWPAALLLKRINQGRRAWMILRQHDRPVPRTLYLMAAKVPKGLKEGTCVYIKKQCLSFFDSLAMVPKEVQVTKFRNAKLFTDALAGIEGD